MISDQNPKKKPKTVIFWAEGRDFLGDGQIFKRLVKFFTCWLNFLKVGCFLQSVKDLQQRVSLGIALVLCGNIAGATSTTMHGWFVMRAC